MRAQTHITNSSLGFVQIDNPDKTCSFDPNMRKSKVKNNNESSLDFLLKKVDYLQRKLIRDQREFESKKEQILKEYQSEVIHYSTKIHSANKRLDIKKEQTDAYKKRVAFKKFSLNDTQSTSSQWPPLISPSEIVLAPESIDKAYWYPSLAQVKAAVFFLGLFISIILANLG